MQNTRPVDVSAAGGEREKTVPPRTLRVVIVVALHCSLQSHLHQLHLPFLGSVASHSVDHLKTPCGVSGDADDDGSAGAMYVSDPFEEAMRLLISLVTEIRNPPVPQYHSDQAASVLSRSRMRIQISPCHFLTTERVQYNTCYS